MRYTLIILLSILSLNFSTQTFAAAALPGTDDKKPDAAPAKDHLERDTPRSMITGFLDALSHQDYDKAANYLDLPRSKQKDDGPDVAKQLQNLLDQSGWVKTATTLSDDPAGDVNDDLPPELEKVGGIRTEKRTLPLLIEHIKPKAQPAYWQFSAETLAEIPALEKEMRSSLLNKYLPQTLIDNQWWGVPVGHWLALLALGLLSYMVMWSITNLLKIIIHTVKRSISIEKTESELVNAFVKPLQIYLSVWISIMVIRYIGVSLLARQIFNQLAQVIGWVSLAWIVWRLIDVFANILRNRLIQQNQYSLLSAVVLLRRGVKLVLAVIVSITVLDSFGFQVTTWLAALGIGGIALALGAQKTVENFVGSLTLIADRPIAIGDFCKFGNAKGTVEDIGMRSTRIRTTDRTLVSIPNGDFASMQIENYSKRDSFYFNPTIGLSSETTPDQLRNILAGLRSMLGTEPNVSKDKIRVNFIEIGTSSLNIEISCYIEVKTHEEAMNIRENINLHIMDIVKKCSAEFASSAPTPAATARG